jgi:RNA polymerase-binding transcription factor DksA
MLTPDQTVELRGRLEAELTRLAANAHSALDFTMDRDRDRIGRDSCAECAEPIGFKRLMARPVTTLCFECKSAREQVEADEPIE